MQMLCPTHFTRRRRMFGYYVAKTHLRLSPHTEFRGFISSPRTTVESLWEEFFRDPTQFYDLRNTKKSHNTPDFRHRRTGEGLWINDFYSPTWVRVKLESTELPPLEDHCHRAAIIHQIKSCGKRKDVTTIRRICAEKPRITDDASIANTLIRSYAKCGALNEAQKVFDQLVERGIVSWNALIAGYAEKGFGKEALACLREMEKVKVIPDAVTYACSLKACDIAGDLETVREIHAQIRQRHLLKKDIVLGTALVNAYAKCGALKEAQEAFCQLTERNVVSWNALIAGYSELDLGEEALRCFREMKCDRVTPNAITYACTLKACAIVGAIDVVEEIHSEMREQGSLNKDTVVGTALVSAYVKCGAMVESRQVFDQLAERDVVSWNALITGYVEKGLGEVALTCFREMESNNVKPDSVTYVSSLKACGIVGDIKAVKGIHTRLREEGLPNEDILTGTALINAYAKCGTLKEAQKIFDQLTKRNVISWNALISAYAKEGYGQEAFACFQQMKSDGVTPDSVTYACCLTACANVDALENVKEIHAQLRVQGLLNKDIVLGNILVNAYVKCSAVKEAQEVFYQLAVRDIVSWNILIGGYIKHGFSEEATRCFREMESDGVTPNLVTYVSSLTACANVGAVEILRDIHVKVRDQGLFNEHNVLGSALVNAYAKCGAMNEAQEVFDQLSERDNVSWSALIAGYTEQGSCEEALACFKGMENDGVAPNSVTFACALKACYFVCALEIVEKIHTKVREHGLLDKNIIIATALINAYSKCGALEQAQEVFEQLTYQDVVSWNSILTGYAQLGLVNQMLALFNRMWTEGILPDTVTFHVLLNGCSHGGLLEEGELLFFMIGAYELAPTAEHYTCMVDLFGRAGQLEKAKHFVLDHTQTLLTFLGGCQIWLDVDRGIWAFQELLQLDQKCVSAYISMANIYRAAGM